MAVLIVGAKFRAARSLALSKALEDQDFTSDFGITPEQAEWNIAPASLMGEMPSTG